MNDTATTMLLNLLHEIGGRVDEAELRHQLDRRGARLDRGEIARLLEADQIEVTYALTAAGREAMRGAAR